MTGNENSYSVNRLWTSPQCGTHDRKESKVVGSQQEEGKYKYVRSVSDSVVPNTCMSTVNRYKLVRSRTSQQARSCAQSNSSSHSMYKLVKPVKPASLEQQLLQSSAARKTKCGVTVGAEEHTKSKYTWTKENKLMSEKPKPFIGGLKLETFNQCTSQTPRTIKTKTRFKLVRKTQKTSPMRLSSLSDRGAAGSRKPTMISRHKLTNKIAKGGKKHGSLVWKK